MRKLSQKKSCKGCRALGGSRCELGFKVRTNAQQPWKDPEPLEPCPKPLTYEQFFAERRRQQEEAGIDTLNQ